MGDFFLLAVRCPSSEGEGEGGIAVSHPDAHWTKNPAPATQQARKDTESCPQTDPGPNQSQVRMKSSPSSTIAPGLIGPRPAGASLFFFLSLQTAVKRHTTLFCVSKPHHAIACHSMTCQSPLAICKKKTPSLSSSSWKPVIQFSCGRKLEQSNQPVNPPPPPLVMP